MKYEITFKHKNELPNSESVRVFGEASVGVLAKCCFEMGKSGIYEDLTVKRVYRKDERQPYREHIKEKIKGLLKKATKNTIHNVSGKILILKYEELEQLTTLIKKLTANRRCK